MAAKRRDAPNLDPNTRPTKKPRNETSGNLPAPYASLCNKTLRNCGNSRKAPEQDSLDRGFIRGIVQRVEWDKQEKSATLVLQLADEIAPSSIENGDKQRVLDCILNKPSFGVRESPSVGEVVDIALTNPAVLTIKETQTTFCFALVFNDVLLQIHQKAHSGEPRIRRFGQVAQISSSNKRDDQASGSNHRNLPNDRSASRLSSLDTAALPGSHNRPGHDRVNPSRKHQSSRTERHHQQKSHPTIPPSRETVDNANASIRPHKEVRRQRNKAGISATDIEGTLEQLAEQERGQQTRQEQLVAEGSDDDSECVVYHLGDDMMSSIPLNVEPRTSPATRVDFDGFHSKHGRFLSLKRILETRAGEQVNVAGLIVAQNPVKKSKDYVLSIKLADRSLESDQWLTVTLFHSNEAFLPKIDVGQMIVLIGLKTRRDTPSRKVDCVGYSDRFKWRGYDQATKKLFFNDLNPGEAKGAPYASVDDVLLEELHKIAGIMKGPESVKLPSFEKHRILSEFTTSGKKGVFIDATVEVLGARRGEIGNRKFMDVFVTDYTPNPRFKAFNFVGAGHEYTLQINIWFDNRLYEVAENLAIGGYYRISNMVSEDRDGFIYGKLPELSGTDITRVADPEDPYLAQLLERKEIFLKNQQMAMIEDAVENFDPEIFCGNPRITTRHEVVEKTGPPVPIARVVSPARLTCTIPGSTKDFNYVMRNPGVLRCRIRGRVIDFLPTNRKDMIIISCKNCGFCIGGGSFTKQLCFKCRTPDNLVYEVKFCLLFVDEDDNYIPIRAFGEEAMRLFSLQTFNFKDGTFDVSTILETIERKLGTITGNVWPLLDSNHPLLASGTAFNVSEMAQLVESPWVDLGIRSWPSTRDLEGKTYDLVDCVFD